MIIGTEASVILGNSGIETYTRELFKALANEFQHDTYVAVTLQRRKEAVANILGNVKNIEIRNKLVHDLVFGEAFRTLAKFVQKMQWQCGSYGLDVVHFTSHFRYFPTKAPIVVTVHDLFPLDETLNIEEQARREFKQSIKSFIDNACAIVTPSLWVKNKVIEMYPQVQNSVFVTPLAAGKPFEVVDVDWDLLQTLGLKKYQQPFVFVGRVDERKNIGRIIKAYSALPEKYRIEFPLLLCVSGVPKYIQQLQMEYAAELKLPTVFLHVGLPTTTIVHALNAAYALVFPSLMEGFGLPALEAMRCGCPVITSNTTSLPEVCESAALYVNPYDEQSIVQQMLYIIENLEYREIMVQNSLEQAKKFSWQQTARLTYEVYKNIVQ